MTLRFEKVSFAYETFTNPAANQLENISFKIQPGEIAGIVGRSGSGKTTLMQLFNGLLIPNQGRILVDGRDLNTPNYDLVTLRRRLGVVFQFPETQLFAATVEEEIAFAPQLQNLAAEEITRRVTEELHRVGLDASFLKRNPLTLSQGEKRRVALASVLAMRPEMLVLDEPTASLDAAGVAEVRGILQNWRKKTGALVTENALVMISHDVDLIASLCPRILVLEQGRLLFDGETKSLWNSSQHNEILKQAGLPLPRYERLRRHLSEKGLNSAEFHF
jgi:energy-coupling factor transport system ATP-binding protein